MKENSELLAQQLRSAGRQDSSRPTIELVTPRAGRDGELSGIICPPNCIPNCRPSCSPTIFPRPPEPPKPPKPPPN